MDPLDQILEKALAVANSSDDPETMLKAVQIASTLGELREKQQGRSWSATALKITPAVAAYTAILAALLSVFTVAFNFYQFRQSQKDQGRREEQSQWREALKNMSTKDDSLVFSSASALQMETFFQPSSPYSKQARSVAIALLPLLGSGDQFDTIWEGMNDYTVAENRLDPVSVARSVASEEYALFVRKAGITGRFDKAAKLKFIDFLKDPESFWSGEAPATIPELTGTHPSEPAGGNSGSSMQNQYAFDLQHNPLKRAQASAWKIDSASQGFAYLWKQKPKQPGDPVAASKLDLTGVVLVNGDYRGVRFAGATLDGIVYNCKLGGADFSGTTLNGAVFEQITDFADSKWRDNANWWDADGLSCGLAHYLDSRYPPAKAENHEKAKTLVNSCRPPE